MRLAFLLLPIAVISCRTPSATSMARDNTTNLSENRSNTDDLSIYDFERVRNKNLAFGKYITWSNLYGCGVACEYFGNTIEVIYGPAQVRFNSCEFLFIKCHNLQIDFTVASINGKINIVDNSEFYYKVIRTKTEFALIMKEIISSIIKDNSKGTHICCPA